MQYKRSPIKFEKRFLQMKKIVSFVMAVVMMAALLVGCGAKKELTFTTGSETGTYYGFGTILASRTRSGILR